MMSERLKNFCTLMLSQCLPLKTEFREHYKHRPPIRNGVPEAAFPALLCTNQRLGIEPRKKLYSAMKFLFAISDIE